MRSAQGPAKKQDATMKASLARGDGLVHAPGVHAGREIESPLPRIFFVPGVLAEVGGVDLVRSNIEGGTLRATNGRRNRNLLPGDDD